jgi:hypothetical protein
VNPRPARTRRLYLRVGHRTIGLSLSTGRGARAAAFARRASRLRTFEPGCRRNETLDTECMQGRFPRIVSLPPLSFVPTSVLGVNRGIPGRNGRKRAAANPCGNLRIQVSQNATRDISSRSRSWGVELTVLNDGVVVLVRLSRERTCQ